ncbi:MAG: PIG-L family deacetylase [Ilumatobacteraceae bacterium]|nr:PIG-L family deacetylase [Ilumatobacteraceae bacterium]
MHVVVAPHIDDCVLSMGGRLLAWQARNLDARVVYVFPLSTWTNPDAPAAEAGSRHVPKIRRREAMTASELLGFEARFLDFWDCADRGGRRDQIRKFLMTGKPVYMGHRMLPAIRRRLSHHMKAATNIYFPIACGENPHPDHVILRDIGLEHRRAGLPVAFYEDLPYAAAGTPEHTVPDDVLSQLAPVDEVIDLDAKLELSQTFASQVSDAWLDSVRSHALALGGHEPVERVWA